MKWHDSKLQTSEQILELFAPIGSYNRQEQLLDLQLLCKLQKNGASDYSIYIEMKVTNKRSYQINHIRRFLQHVQDQSIYAITKSFSYNPSIHGFSHADSQLLSLLHSLCMQENRMDYTNEKQLLIPPTWWKEVSSRLQACSNVQMEYIIPYGPLDEQLHQYNHLEWSQDKPPLSFTFQQHDNGNDYIFNAKDFHKAILLPPYECMCIDGKFYAVPYERLYRMKQLQDIYDNCDYQPIVIDEHHMSKYMDYVVPHLFKVSQIEMDDNITSKVIQKPLQAKIFLDRIRDKIFVGIEFHYGDLFVQPLEPEDRQRSSSHIILRERDKEQEILQLFNECPCLQTEGGFVIEGEDDEYHFFHHILPKLSLKAIILATRSIKLRYEKDTIIPQVVLNWDEKSDWLQFEIKMDGISDQEIKGIIEALSKKKKYVKLSNHALLSLETPSFQSLIRVMNEWGLQHPGQFDDQYRISIQHALSLLHDDQQLPKMKLSKSLRKLIAHLRNPDHFDFPLPSSLTAQLRDYQAYGYQWMRTLAKYRFGGILADEMGLGKTIQAIAFIQAIVIEKQNSNDNTVQPVLILAPSSLLYNWSKEFSKFAPEMQVQIIDGNKDERNAYITQYNKKEGAHSQIWITSYPLLRQDLELHQKVSFQCIIFDEAQNFKNDYTHTAKAVQSLQASYRFALTGTPIENRLDELWSILHTVNPILFPNKRVMLEMERDKLLQRISPFVLRRLKQDVLMELPPKIETTLTAPLTLEQRKLYFAYLAQLQEETLKHLDPKKKGENRIRMLAGITRLRQICCHPGLFQNDYEGTSAKLTQLLELVEDCMQNGKRILIFSQFTEMLQLIKTELTMMDYPYFYLDGSTPASERVEMCTRFNEGEHNIFLLSLKAGGTGLNLTGADTVILYDLWWNPAIEQQATDRAHRIGQNKIVQIIRLVSEGTIEEKMLQLQQRKQQLIDEVLQLNQEASLQSLTEEDLLELLHPQST